MAEPIIIVGHKNPDNDAISAAVGLAFYMNEMAKRQHEGEAREYKPVRLGPLPPETEWNLNQNGLPLPELIESVAEGQEVILVDHNELSQAVDGLEQAEIVAIVDHHRIGDVTTAGPIFFNCRPWGSTATVVTSMLRQEGIEIPVSIANVLLSAILIERFTKKQRSTNE